MDELLYYRVALLLRAHSFVVDDTLGCQLDIWHPVDPFAAAHAVADLLNEHGWSAHVYYGPNRIGITDVQLAEAGQTEIRLTDDASIF